MIKLRTPRLQGRLEPRVSFILCCYVIVSLLVHDVKIMTLVGFSRKGWLSSGSF